MTAPSTTPDAPTTSARERKPEAGDGLYNGEHNGAKAAENPGPGTPGNVAGAGEGKNSQAESATPNGAAEQSTVSSPASGHSSP